MLYHSVELRTVRVVVLEILHSFLDLGDAGEVLIQTASGAGTHNTSLIKEPKIFLGILTKAGVKVKLEFTLHEKLRIAHCFNYFMHTKLPERSGWSVLWQERGVYHITPIRLPILDSTKPETHKT